MGRKMPSATERIGATEQRRQNRRIWADEWTLPMRILEGADIGYIIWSHPILGGKKFERRPCGHGSELIVRPSLKSLVVLFMFAFHFSLWSRPFQLWSWPLSLRMISGLKPKQPQKRIPDSSTERHTFGSLTLINFISKTIAHMAKHNGNDDFRIHIFTIAGVFVGTISRRNAAHFCT